MKNHWNFTENELDELLQQHYGFKGKITPMPGEVDRNFRIDTSKERFLLKLSPQDTSKDFLQFQTEVLSHLEKQENSNKENPIVPKIIFNKEEQAFGEFEKTDGQYGYIRLLTWVEGMVWNSIKRHNDALLISLGGECGKLTDRLYSLSSSYKRKEFDWDISNALWTQRHQYLFEASQRELTNHFIQGFSKVLPQLRECRHSIVHNDANDHNVLVAPKDEGFIVRSIIDYGDALYTASINDLAVTLTYSLMDKEDPLEAAIPVIQGYHREFPLKHNELAILYWLIGARLVISLTKSAINKQQEPKNTYLTISETQAWSLINKWKNINPEIAEAHFRFAAELPAHPLTDQVTSFLKKNSASIQSMLGATKGNTVTNLALDIGSSSIPNLSDYHSSDRLHHKVWELWKEKDKPIMAGGYGEIRPEYITKTHQFNTNNGPHWKTKQLALQLWRFEPTEIRNPLKGRLHLLKENMLVLEHELPGQGCFYSIYKNLLTQNTNDHLGIEIKNGGVLGSYNTESTRPFSIQFSLLDPVQQPSSETCFARDWPIFKDLYLDPSLLLELTTGDTTSTPKNNSLEVEEIIRLRETHLGRSLSLSYRKPLKILRGDGVYLIDHTGRKYLDLVNNVAHVGHEHPSVVKASQQQMAMLNTNSRYLHPSIVEFAQNLLKTLPNELSVVHFVNSGSEANELAIRMAKTYTGQEDFISLEMGYHGNSNACIDVSSYKFDGKGGSGAPPTTHVVPLPDSLRGIYRGPGQGTQYSSHVQQYIDDLEKRDRKPAAFIAESIISCAGQVELPDGFLQQAYQMVKKAGGLCIADEVQVGLGRMGSSFWGFQLHGVLPDIVTIGKPLGNGHPLAAVVCTLEVAERFANGMEYFNTFGGNPVSCAIGNSVLNVIQDEELQKNAEETGAFLKASLQELGKEFPILADVRGQGLFLGIELLDSHGTPLPLQTQYVVQRMKELAYLMSTEGPDNNVLKIKPPLVFKKEHAELLVRDLRKVFGEDFMKVPV